MPKLMPEGAGFFFHDSHATAFIHIDPSDAVDSDIQMSERSRRAHAYHLSLKGEADFLG